MTGDSRVNYNTVVLYKNANTQVGLSWTITSQKFNKYALSIGTSIPYYIAVYAKTFALYGYNENIVTPLDGNAGINANGGGGGGSALLGNTVGIGNGSAGYVDMFSGAGGGSLNVASPATSTIAGIGGGGILQSINNISYSLGTGGDGIPKIDETLHPIQSNTGQGGKGLNGVGSGGVALITYKRYDRTITEGLTKLLPPPPPEKRIDNIIDYDLLNVFTCNISDIFSGTIDFYNITKNSYNTATIVNDELIITGISDSSNAYDIEVFCSNGSGNATWTIGIIDWQHIAPTILQDTFNCNINNQEHYNINNIEIGKTTIIYLDNLNIQGYIQ